MQGEWWRTPSGEREGGMENSLLKARGVDKENTFACLKILKSSAREHLRGIQASRLARFRATGFREEV